MSEQSYAHPHETEKAKHVAMSAADRPPATWAAIGFLEESTNRVLAELGVLTDHLGPIMRSAEVKPEGARDFDSEGVDIAHRISQQAHRLADAADDLRALHRRVAL